MTRRLEPILQKLRKFYADGTIYPQSPYVPESHYILALTYEQINQDEESIRELLVLLKKQIFILIKSQASSKQKYQRSRSCIFKQDEKDGIFGKKQVIISNRFLRTLSI